MAKKNQINLNKRLIDAAERGDVKALAAALDAGAHVDAVDSEGGWTTAMIASECGYVDCLRVLADRKADLEMGTEFGWTPVFIAVDNGHVDCLMLLADRGADLDKSDLIDGCTPTILAASQGDIDCLRALAELNADLDKANDYDWTPAILAAFKGQTDCLCLLADLGADLDSIDFDGLSAADYAEAKGHAEAAEFLRSFSLAKKERAGLAEAVGQAAAGRPSARSL